MRAALLFLALVGCGPVRLGDEAAPSALDARAADPLDAAAAPEVTVTVRAGAGCEACFTVEATAAGGLPPYTFEWADGRRDAERTVCPDTGLASMSVVARDAEGRRSAPHLTRLEGNDAACPELLALCLQNRSFEGMPAYNASAVAPAFDLAPWSACSNPAFANTPDVTNDTIPQMITVVPKATDGATFLGLAEGEQASQRLCESLPGGSAVSMRIDLARLDISGGVTLNTEQAFLEIWGGVASDCSRNELLWASPPLSEPWHTFCATLRPQQFTDNLTLRAGADGTLPTVIYLVADRLVPVESCP